MRAHIDQDHRYAHILRVARIAEALAVAHHLDPRQARLAGLLHDLARLYPGERLLRESAERGLAIDDFERANPIVLHARLGAELAREWFGVDDEAILSAIRKHTLAAATMSPLDEILYLADGLEPGRDFVGRADILRWRSLICRRPWPPSLPDRIAYYRERNLHPAPQTLAALDHYTLTVNREKRSA